MARILVTGGTGYIGSHTVVELMQKGYDVVIVDNLSNSNVDMLDGVTSIVGQRPPFEQVDCNDALAMQQVFEKSEQVMWECRICGHLVVGKKAPGMCPVCAHPQSFFEVRKENY